MRTTLPRVALFGALVLFTLPARSADDPLPAGAKLRLGDARFYFRFSPGFAPLPPDFKAIAFPGEGEGLRTFKLDVGRTSEKHASGPSEYFILSADGSRYALVRVIDVSVRDSANGTELQRFRRPPMISAPVVSDPAVVSLSADGKLLAWGGELKDGRGVVAVRDVDRDEVLFEAVTVHPTPAVGVLSADGKLLATRAYPVYIAPGPGGKPKVDETTNIVQVWDVAAKKQVFQAKLTPADTPRLADLVFSPDGRLLAASFGNGTIDWWDVKTGQARKSLLGQATQGQRLAFSPDGKTLASAGTIAVQRWATADGKPLPTTDIPATIPAHFPRGLRFADNDRVLVWGYVSNTAVVWEAPAGKALTPFPSHTAWVRSIGFPAGGKEVVTSGADARTVRWDAATGKPLGRVTLKPSRPGPTPVLTLSPDAARGLSHHPPAVFDLATGEELFAVPRGKAVRDGVAVAVTPDLTKVAVVTLPADRKGQATCAVWDLARREKIGEVEIGAGFTSYPAVGISPSGERVVTAFQPYLTADGVILNKRPPMVITAWDVKAGKVLGKTEDVNVGQPAVAVASESYAVVASDTGQLRAYDFESGKGGEVFEHSKPRRATEVGPVVFSPDRKRFAVARPADPIARPGDVADIYGVRVYEWPSGAELHTFLGHTAPVTAIAFAPDGKTLATGAQDTTVLLWDVSKSGK